MFESLARRAAIWTGVLGLVVVATDASAEAPCPRVGFTLVERSASSETRPVKLGDRTIFVRREALTTTSDIAEIKVAGDDEDTLVLIKLTPAAAARLLEATTGHDGLNMAFVVDDDVLLAVTWQGPYGIGPDGIQLSIPHGMARAKKLLESTRGCTADPRRP